MSRYFCLQRGGGVFSLKGNAWIIFAGAIASSCDTLVRLIYQKYQNVSRELSDKNIIPPQRETRTENEYSGSLRVRLEMEPGIGGIIPTMVFAASVFNALDLVIFYMDLYYCSGALIFIVMYTVRAMRFRNLPMKV